MCGHREPVTAVALCRGGAWIASTARDHALRLWSLETGDALDSFTGEGVMTAVAGGDRHVVAGESSGRLHFLRLEESAEVIGARR